MCGIIAVVRRPTDRAQPTSAEVVTPLEQALSELRGVDVTVAPSRLDALAAEIADVDRRLRGAAGVTALVQNPALLGEVVLLARELADRVTQLDTDVDQVGAEALAVDGGRGIEALNAALVRLKDAVWAVDRDRVRTAQQVRLLVGRDTSDAAVAAYLSIQQALSALDRLEVRGRDSAGLHVLVRGHGLDLTSSAVASELARRSADPLFASGSVRVGDGQLGFVYKAAAEIGELGDNTRALRDAISDDTLLRRALSAPTAEAVVLAHTRWASVGIISQPNAHPLNSEEIGIEWSESGSNGDPDAETAPHHYLTAVLNGDVDNFADLKATEALRIPPEITTDAKVIPTLVSRHWPVGRA